MSKITRFVSSAVVATVLLLGAGTSPVQAADLTTPQINSIVALLKAFGADQSVINDVQTALGGTLPAQSSSCVNLTSNMTLGSTDANTGGDVTTLQTYLAQKGYFTYTGPKGYYGMVTAEAVGQYQIQNNVVGSVNDTAYGITGPQTRSSISSGTGCSHTCANGGTNYPTCTAPVTDTCGTGSGTTPQNPEPTGTPACAHGTLNSSSPADTALAWKWSCGTVTSCTAPKYGCTTTTDSNYNASGPANTWGCSNTCANGETNYPTCTAPVISSIVTVRRPYKNGSIFATGASGNQSELFSPPGSYTLELYYGSKKISSGTFVASCASGSSWDSVSLTCK